MTCGYLHRHLTRQSVGPKRAALGLRRSADMSRWMHARLRTGAPVAELPDDFTGETGRILLDIRESDEWEQGHIRRAASRWDRSPSASMRSIPTRRFSSSAGPVDVPFRMLEYFEHVGYDAVCVEGGMVAWEAGGKPVVVGE